MADWRTEMYKMLVAIDGQVAQTLRTIKAMMEFTDQKMDPGFKSYFLQTVNQEVEKSFDRFDMTSHWESDNSTSASRSFCVNGNSVNTEVVKKEPKQYSVEVEGVIVLDSDSSIGESDDKQSGDEEAAANGNKRYKCSDCEYSNDNKSNLINHLRTHSGEKPFRCDECQKCFSRKHNFRNHMLTHSGEKPFRCDECQNSFSQKCVLRRHKLTHTGLKPFRCDECQNSFSQEFVLRRHMLTHTGLKPFQCDRCTQKFTRKMSLKEHMKNHAGDFEFQCVRCFDGFANIKQKIKHETNCNGRKYECFICKKYTTLIFSRLQKHMIMHSRKKRS